MKKLCLIVIAALVILILYIMFGSKSVFGPSEVEDGAPLSGANGANGLNSLNLEELDKEFQGVNSTFDEL